MADRDQIDADLGALSWSAPAESPTHGHRSARSPGEPDFYLSAYEPTLRDRISAYFIGDQMPTVERRRLVEGLFGSSGSGHTSVGLADVAPGGPGYWLDALTHMARDERSGAATDIAKAMRVGVPYAIAGRFLRRGQDLGRFALTVPEAAALVGVASSFASEHNGKNPLYGPGSAYGSEVTTRNRLAEE